MLKLLHAGDFHLDSPFRSLPLGEAQRRRREQRRALDALRDLAVAQKADLALLAGDLFDTKTIYPETVEALSAALEGFPCPVCISPGNHDPFSDHSPYNTHVWPDNVYIFRDPAVSALPFPALGARVYGFAFPSPVLADDPLAGFQAPQDGLVNLGVFHTQVGKGAQYAPVDPASLAHSGLAYAALGHVHQTTPPDLTAPTPWAYCGCLMGRGFDEPGDKGAAIVTIDGGRVTDWELVPLAQSRYLLLEAEVTGQDPQDALLRVLGHGHGEDYCRVTLKGEAAALDLDRLQAAARDRCRALELRDETVLPLDIWARAEEETLTGFFLREMRRRLDGETDPDARRTLQLALRYGLAALEGRDAPNDYFELDCHLRRTGEPYFFPA